DLQQPHRGPGVLRHAGLDLARAVRRDQVQGPVAVAERPADHDEPVVDQAVHERGVLVPGGLFPDRPRAVPARTVGRGEREIGHAVTLPAATDSATYPGYLPRLPTPHGRGQLTPEKRKGQALPSVGPAVPAR